ncbi:hypothetical protein V8C42DRAFT_308355 [Trichoderma barbatum]
MNKAAGFYAALAALLAAADARNLNQLPRATAASDYAFDGFSPKPTEAIKFPFHHAIQRRAGSSSSSAETVYLAPDATCGFISGLAGAGYTCGVSATCVFFTSSTAPGHVACCNSVECNARNTCINYEEFFSSSKCNDGCRLDTFTLKCTNSARPYCNTLSFPGDILDVFCNSDDFTEVLPALTTYRGQSSRRFTPLALTDDAPISSAANDFTSTTPSSSDSTTSSSTSTTTTPGPTTPPPKSSSNTGAIVGGVVGGVAGLGLIGLGAFFFLRRKRNKKAAQQEAMAQVPPVYQDPGVQPTPQSQFDPKFAAATGQYPQQYPPQQGYYQTSPEGQTISPVDPRFSTAASSTSPTPSGGYVAPGAGGFHPQENVIHEAPAQASENHRGQMHELA